MAAKYFSLFITIFFLAQTFAHHHHTKRPTTPDPEHRILGGIEEISVTQQAVVEYVANALKTLSAKYPGDNHPMIKEIIKATKQLVAGTSYKISVIVGTSDCPKDKELTKDCSLLEDSPVKLCNISVWVQEWIKFEEIKVTCEE